jgi:hypothetical protein
MSIPAAADGQYHRQSSQKTVSRAASDDRAQSVVSRRNRTPISRSNGVSIDRRTSRSLVRENPSQVRPNLLFISRAAAEEPQYQPRKGRYRLLIGLGVVLGGLYVAFLGLWYWATRIRPRAIDTTRRML